MILILEIAAPSAMSRGGESRGTFGPDGGTLGRDTDNTWVLPHPKVSAHHAVITCESGVYYIEDRSTNGIGINSSKNRLTRHRPYALKSGDVLFIDPYEIRVSVGGDRGDAREEFEDDAFAIGSGGASAPIAGVDVVNETVDPLRLLGAGPKPAKRNAAAPQPRARDLERASPLEQHFQPPAAIRDPALPPPAPPRSSPPPRPRAFEIPEGYDPLADEEPATILRRPAPGRPAVERPSAAPAIDIPNDYDPLAPDEPDTRPRQANLRSPEPIESAPIAGAPLAGTSPVSAPVDIPHDYDPLAAVEPAPKGRGRSGDGAGTEQSPPPRGRSGDRAGTKQSPPPPIPAPEPPPAPDPARGADPVSRDASGGGFDFADVLAGAGLDATAIAPDVARDFGRIIRAVVAGLMDVLRARQQIKDEFRMRMTRFRPAENNPLKFSANVEDALHNLLVKRNPAYLPAVDAFEDAFDDLRSHQIAMLAGMRVAFEAMLAEFDPERLQQEFDRLNKGLVPAKLRYWDLYREKREELLKDPETAFRRLFGEAFAQAYEDQLRQLKSPKRAAQKGTPDA